MKAFELLAILYLSGVPLSLALDIRGPYLTDLRPDRAIVIAHTKEDTALILEYHEKTNPDPTLREQSQKARQHVFHLNNLKPGSDYSYRILGTKEGTETGDFETEPHVFATPPEHPAGFSFIAYGDSRDSSKIPKRHRAVANHFRKHDPAFIVSTGDLLIGGKTASSSLFSEDWTLNFFEPLGGVIDAIPFYLTVGNHDQDSPHAITAVREAFPNLKRAFNYSFRHADTLFIVLHVANQMQEFQSQKAWFIEELEKGRDADWRIVFLHVSPFTNGKYREMEWTLEGRADFLETCVKHNVDLVLSGHDHSYQRFHPLRSAEKDTHSVLFVVTALAGTNPYPAQEDPYTAKVVNRTDHFCVIDVTSDSLTLTAYDNRNKAFDKVGVSKTASEPGMVWRPSLSPGGNAAVR